MKKNIDLNKMLKISIITGVLLISFSVAYHFLIFVPKQEQLDLEQYNQEKTDECLAGLKSLSVELAGGLVERVQRSGVQAIEDFNSSIAFARGVDEKARNACAKRFGGVVR